MNFIYIGGNFKSPQKILKFIVAILKRSVFGVYLFNSHAQTTALISSTLIFQSFFELLLKLPHKIHLINNIACGTDFFKLKNISEHLSYSKEKYPFYNKETRRGKIRWKFYGFFQKRCCICNFAILYYSFKFKIKEINSLFSGRCSGK